MGLDNYGFSTSFSSREGGFQFYVERNSTPDSQDRTQAIPEPPWTTLLLRVFFSGVHDAVMLLEGNAQCEHVVLNSVLVDAFRNCWVPKLWLRPGVSPRSMCQIHQFGDCLVISAIFFEIFPQGDAVAGWYFCWTKKESWFQFQPLVCDLLFLYREMIAVIHFVVCSSRSSHEEMSGLPQIKGKMVRSLCTRLKGKEGRLLLCRWTGRWAKEIYGVMDSHSPHYWVVDLSAGEVFFASPGNLCFFQTLSNKNSPALCSIIKKTIQTSKNHRRINSNYP